MCPITGASCRWTFSSTTVKMSFTLEGKIKGSVTGILSAITDILSLEPPIFPDLRDKRTRASVFVFHFSVEPNVQTLELC